MVLFAHPAMGSTTEAKQRAVYAYLGVFTPLATLVMFLRLYIRIKAANMGPEDYVIVVSWAFATVHSALVINEIKNGLGMHIESIPPPHMIQLMKSFYFILISYTVAIGSFKTSILLQYLRIFQIPSFLRICYVLIGVVVMFTLSFLFVAIFQCKPVPFFWQRLAGGEGTCLDPAKVWVSMNAINITTDIFIFVLPLPVLYNLAMPRRMKYGIMLIFALGLFVVVMSIIRLPSVYLICTSMDLPWDSVPATIWTIIELNTAIICASLPALRILGLAWVQRFVDATRRATTAVTGRPSPAAAEVLPSSRPVGVRGTTRHPDLVTERQTGGATEMDWTDEEAEKRSQSLTKTSSVMHLNSATDSNDQKSKS